MDRITAGVVQAATVWFDTPATVEKAKRLLAEAAERGCRLVVFPEAFIGGYPKGADFHIYVGGRTPEGREDFRAYFASAVAIDGPEVRALAEAAGAHRLYAVIGILERDGGTLYCTALYLAPDGPELGKPRKLMHTAAGRPML